MERGLLWSRTLKANMYTDAVLQGQRVVLVSSTPDHVEKYHQWMTDPQLLKDTGTEPLTLDEVYEMESAYIATPSHPDERTKLMQGTGGKIGILTFIILANGESLPMVGDVNLFLKGDPGDKDFEAEVGVMIAEEGYRRKGLALEALQLLLSYATASPTSFAITPLSPLPDPPAPFPIRPESLVVRIGQDNVASIRLFERLGFIEQRGPNAFGEKELRCAKRA